MPGFFRTVLLLSRLLRYSTSVRADPAEKTGPNVLFIPIDDLNDWMAHLGEHPPVSANSH